MALVEVKRDLEKQVRELTHRLDIALEHEVACAEQRQRADMAEASQHSTRILLEEEEADNEDNRHLLNMAKEREKSLRDSLADAERIIAALYEKVREFDPPLSSHLGPGPAIDALVEREKKLREALEKIGLKAALITTDDNVTDPLLVRITAINEEARSAVRNA